MGRRLLGPLIAGAAIAAMGSAATGCAGMRVYSDPALTRETGIKVFAPKPYLLVARTGSKTNPVALSVVYLPDPSDVVYVRQQRGWGSADLSLKVHDGMLAELGAKSDSQIPATLDALAPLLKAATEAYAAARESRALSQEPDVPSAPAFELYEIRIEQGRTRLVRVTIGPGA